MFKKWWCSYPGSSLAVCTKGIQHLKVLFSLIDVGKVLQPAQLLFFPVTHLKSKSSPLSFFPVTQLKSKISPLSFCPVTHLKSNISPLSFFPVTHLHLESCRHLHSCNALEIKDLAPAFLSGNALKIKDLAPVFLSCNALALKDLAPVIIISGYALALKDLAPVIGGSPAWGQKRRKEVRLIHR